MPSMKCVSCGIGFFSPDGSTRCAKCSKDSPAESSGHGSCGCGHSH